MNTTDRARLLNLLSIQSASRNSGAMRRHMVAQLRAAGCDVTVADRQIYAWKGSGIRPVYVAHSDTVHAVVPEHKYRADAFIDGSGEVVWYAYDPMTDEQRGVGGDDKCGLWVALEAARALDDVGVIITRDEEIGAVGARAIDPAALADAACLIEADRRGNDEAIVNGSTTDWICSAAWAEAVAPTLAAHGYSLSDAGTYTDVVAMIDDGIATVSAVNLSAGYYDAHTSRETIRESELETCTALAIALGRVSAGTRWEHIPERRFYDERAWHSGAQDWTQYRYKPSKTHAANAAPLWDILDGPDDPIACDALGCSHVAETERDRIALCWYHLEQLDEAELAGISPENAATLILNGS